MLARRRTHLRLRALVATTLVGLLACPWPGPASGASNPRTGIVADDGIAPVPAPGSPRAFG